MQRSCWLQLKVSIINNALVSKVWEPLNACVEYRLRWMYFGVLMISSSYFLQPLSDKSTQTIATMGFLLASPIMKRD